MRALQSAASVAGFCFFYLVTALKQLQEVK